MASGMLAPTRLEVISLFRSLLRTAQQFSDYNIREYTKRRVIDGFRDPTASYAHGKAQLEVARRQVLIYSLYAPKVKSIMDLKH